MPHPLRVLIAMSITLSAAAAATPWDVHGALRADGSIIRHADGTPFFWLGDTAWGMCFRLDRSQVANYLENRRAKGFTVIQTVALGYPGFTGGTGPQNPANRYGHRAFAGGDTPDLGSPLVVTGGTPTAPNDYWDHVDYIVDTAAAKGLYVALLPQWGWAYNSLFTTASAKAYGRFIGQRYGDRKNIIWVIGGDHEPSTTDHIARYRAMAEGVLTGVTGATLAYNQAGTAWNDVFMTFHPYTGPGSSSSQWFHADQWLDTNMYQSGGYLPKAYDLAISDRAKTPTKPTVMGEGTYEGGTRTGSGAVADAWKVRRQAWHSLTGGVAGHTYGHDLIWDNRSGWENAMNAEGAGDMTVLKAFWTARPWTTFVPDSGIVASGATDGSVDGGDDRKTAVRSTGGAVCVVYFPVNTAGGIRLDRITTSDTVLATWMDPRSGATQSAGSYARAATPTFTPPSGWQDAVLLLEAGGTPPANQAPTVAITAPAAGASYAAGADVTITATASDNDGSVAKVAFYHGTTLIGEDAISPFSLTWSAAAAGSWQLTAVATDDDGASTTSAAVAITVAATTGGEVLGINLNGPGVTIDGLAWNGDGEAGLGFSTTADRTATSSLTPSPAVDSATRSMLNSARWDADGDLAIRQTVASGDYDVYLWVMENYLDNARSFALRLEGTQVATGLGTLKKAEWRRYGPYAASVTDGALDLVLVKTTGQPHLMGLEIHRQGTTPANQAPTVALTAPAAGTSVTSGASVALSATAADSDGTITRVAFYHGANLIAEDTTSPYEVTWTAVEGSWQLTALATDDRGASTTSAPVAITVNAATAPSLLTAGDIGAVAAAGSTSEADGVFTVRGSGADIWGSADEFHFARMAVSGDLDITVRVASVTAIDPWTKAGVMIRDTLNANGKHAHMCVSGSSGAAFQRRTTSGGTSTGTTVTDITAPHWLRLTRRGTTFTGYRSADGVAWTQAGQVSITMGTTVQVGLAVTAHADGQIATAVFEQLEIVPVGGG